MHSALFRFRAGSADGNIFVFGGQYLEVIDEGEYIYPITNNITLATVFPHAFPEIDDKEEDSAALTMMACGPVSFALVILNALRRIL